MKKKLYNLLVPPSIRDRLYKMHIQQYLQNELVKREEFEGVSILVDLGLMHIRQLRVLTNTSELLGRLPKRARVVVVGDVPWEFINQIFMVTNPKRLCLICSNNRADALSRQFRKDLKNGRMELLVGEPEFELAKLPDRSFNWMYLSSDSLSTNTTLLLELGGQKVVTTGLIIGNNYTTGDWITLSRFGVIEAVNTFCKKFFWEMVYLTNEGHRNLHYAIKRLRRR